MAISDDVDGVHVGGHGMSSAGGGSVMHYFGLAIRSVLGLLACLLSAFAYAAEDDPVLDVDELMLRWIEVERQANVLATSWRQQQPVLEQQLLLLEREQEELGLVLEQSRATRDDAEARRLELVEEQTSLEQEQRQLEQTLNGTIVALEDASSALPPPLEDAWAGRLSRLRSELLSNSERLQLVVTLLTQLEDFDNEITLHEEVIQDDDGESYLVRQVYLGLSHGWYVSADRSRAAYGYVTDDGWQWQASDEAATIAEFIAIVEGRQPAALLSVPIELSAAASGTAADAPR